jgi:hypothetical protein
MSLYRLDASIRVEGSHSRILADVWNLDLEVVEADFTLVGVNPALDRFTDPRPPAAPGGRGAGAPPRS